MSTIVFCIISLILPIILVIYIYFKTNIKFSIFIIGFLTFFISQDLIRIPILQYIAYMGISYDNSFPKQMLLCLSAGLVEVGADYLAFKLIIKKNTLGKSIVVGLAHGFCENLIPISLPLIITIISGNPVQLSYMASFERLFALISHIAFALFAFYAIENRNIIYLLIGILLHGFNDLLIFITPNLYIMEISIALLSILELIVILILVGKNAYIDLYDDIHLFKWKINILLLNLRKIFYMNKII